MKITNKALSIHQLGGRQNQEDSIYPEIGEKPATGDLYIVCDGMGGHSKGEVASAAVCQAMSEYVISHPTEDGSFGEDDFNAALAAAYDKLDSLDDPEDNDAKKMGTTLTFLKFHSGGAFIAHIGDSRIYHIRPLFHKIMHVTRDHSLVNDLIDLGELTPEEARTSKQKNIITRAMQPHQERRTKADCLNIEDVRKGDYFYMCTDGMLESSEDSNILNIISMLCRDKTKIDIFTKVTEDNSDNHSAHLIRVTAVSKEEGQRKQPEQIPSEKISAKLLQKEPDTKELEENLPAGKHKWLVIAGSIVLLGAVAYLFIFPNPLRDLMTDFFSKISR